eukprot:scaffold44662_cov28-Tisochrysis_lutea.AAC.5
MEHAGVAGDLTDGWLGSQQAGGRARPRTRAGKMILLGPRRRVDASPPAQGHVGGAHRGVPYLDHCVVCRIVPSVAQPTPLLPPRGWVLGSAVASSFRYVSTGIAPIGDSRRT